LKTLNPITQAACSAHGTSPLIYVELGFNSPRYLTSGPTSTWDGRSWLEWGVAVSGLAATGAAGRSGTLTLLNTGAEVSDVILTEGIKEKSVKIWAAWGHLTARTLTDVVPLFVGEMGAASIAPDLSGVTIRLSSKRFATSVTPRKQILAIDGFRHQPPQDQTFKIGAEVYRLSSNT
jgi:hypothetical protein